MNTRMLLSSVVTMASVLLGTPAVWALSPFSMAVTNLNPVAYWPLQETVQPPIADVEPNVGSLGAVANAYYSGTNLTRGLTGVTTGDSDTAVKCLNANGSWLAVPTTDSRISLPVGPFTVEAWVEPAASANGGYTVVAQTGVAGSGGLNGTANASGWALVQNLDIAQNNGNFLGWSFHVFNGVGATGGADALVATNFTLNNWYHLVGVYDGTNAYLYVNGVNTSVSTSIGGNYSRDTWDPLTIGAAWQNVKGYQGWLDEIAIYTNALTAGQIQNHYNNVGSSTYSSIITNTDNAYMYWRMDAPLAWQNPPAVSAYPLAVNFGSAFGGNGLYLSGTRPGIAGPTSPGLGSPSYGCAFNGIGTDITNSIKVYMNGTGVSGNNTLNSGILLTNMDAPLIRSNQPETLLCWFRANPADGARFQNLIGLHGDSGARLAFQFGQLQWYSGAGNNLASPTTYNDGNWHFVVGVYTNAGTFVTGTNFLYVDGLLVGTAANSSSQSPVQTTNIAVLLGGDAQRAASGNGNTYNERFGNVSLAHVAYFTNALTSSQAFNLYTNATAGALPGAPFIPSQPFPYPSIRVVNAGPVGPGTNYIFEAVVANGGTPTLGYQWYYNTSSNYASATALNDALNGGTNYIFSQTSQITITNLTTANSGYYFCVVNNNYGSTTSAIVAVQVYAAPLITAQSPAGPFNLFPNQKSALSVTAASGVPVSYQWLTNGVADAAAGTGATYSLTAGTAPALSGSTYQCIVTNVYGSATSVLATLTVTPFPAKLTNSAYATNILAMLPTGYWRMHETTPPVAGAMETNYGSLGKLANGYYADWTTNLALTPVIRGVQGALAGSSDTAVDFNANVAANGATPGYLVVPHSSSGTTLQPPFSVELWFNPQNSVFGDLASQFGEGQNSVANRFGFRLIWAGNFEAGFGDPSAAQTYNVITSANHANGQWYHVVATVDTSSNIFLYVNGNAEVSATPFTHPISWDPSIPWMIGNGFSGATLPARPCDGVVDEVAFYTNILTQDRVQAHYNSGIDPVDNGTYNTNVLADAPAVYYHMDAPPYIVPPVSSWPVVTNYGTLPLNGVYTPGTLPGAAAGPGSAAGFAAGFAGTNAMAGNGVSSFADLGFNSLYNPVGATGFSFSAWYRGNPGDARSWQTIMGHSDSSFRAAFNSTGKQTGHGGANDVTSGVTYNDGNWHCFVTTFTGTNVTYGTPATNTGTLGITTLYVDGAQVGQTAGGANAGSTLDLMVGNDPQYTNNPIGLGRSFAGSICEAAFFSGTVLSSNQVQTLYNASGIPPAISTQPITGRAVNGGAGTYTNFNVVASGSGPLAYQWYFNSSSNYSGATALANGAKYASANTAQVTVTNLSDSDSGFYFVVVTNSSGSVTSALASLTVYSQPGIISQYPVPYTNRFTLFAGVSPVFSISAIGALPIYYYWITNGVLAGATTNSSLTMTNVQASFTNYCIVSNFVGSVTSFVWAASVIAAPTGPYPQAVLAAKPVGYWRLNEADDGSSQPGGQSDGNEGAICHDYTGGNDGIYTNISLGYTGYNTNTDPSVTSALFGLSQVAPKDSAAGQIQGIDFTTPTNNSATFSIEAWVNSYSGSQANGAGIVTKGYGNGGEQFDLDVNGNKVRFFVRDVSGVVHGPTSTFTLDANWHHLVGVCDEVHSNVSLYIDGILAGSSSVTPGSGILKATNAISIGSRMSGANTDNDFQFLGYINDVAVYNYALSSAQVAGQYSAAGVPPSLASVAPAGVTNDGGGTLVLPAIAIGTPPLYYSWYDVGGGTNVTAGSTNAVPLNATLTVSNVPGAWNNDSLELTVSNAYGVTNYFVTLTILTNAPQIIQDLPLQVTIPSGKSYLYSIAVTGPAPYGYQWYNMAGPIGGQTSPTYSVTAGSPGSTTYYVVITNIFGATTSSVSMFPSVAQLTTAYATSILGLHPVGYWPLQETNPPAPVTMETNYGTLGTLGNAYYTATNASMMTFGQGGALQGDSDTAAVVGGVGQVSFAFVPRISPALTIQAPFSLEAWVNQNNTTYGVIIGEGGGTGLNGQCRRNAG